MKIKTLKFLILVLAFSGIIIPVLGQNKVLNNPVNTRLVQQTIDSIYNLNFKAADSLLAILDNKFGEYPGNLLLKAFYTNWKFKPIKEEHESYQVYESYLNKSIDLCEKMLDKDEDDEEANFYIMASHAFLAELYVNNDHSFKALGEAKNAYKYVKIGFDQVESNPEFYFSSGVYNYYREKYPEENPFYKSFLWFFRSGDMKEGLSMLKKGATLASFTKAECLTYLYHIYLRYEDKPEIAMQYATILKNKYPKNLHYIANYVENSCRLHQYSSLLPDIEKLLKSDQGYYKYLGEIFYGEYLEKGKYQLDEALIHFEKAFEIGSHEACNVPHYDCIMYLGMGRVYQAKGKKDLATENFKKSIKSAEYQAYRSDAEQLLKN